jgi:hypothetical protein
LWFLIRGRGFVARDSWARIGGRHTLFDFSGDTRVLRSEGRQVVQARFVQLRCRFWCRPKQGNSGSEKLFIRVGDGIFFGAVRAGHYRVVMHRLTHSAAPTRAGKLRAGSLATRFRGRLRRRGARHVAWLGNVGISPNLVFMLDAGDGLGPVNIFAEAGVGADGFDIGRGGELDVIAVLENIFDGEEIIAAALVVETGGRGMAINDAAVFESKMVSDPPGTAPVNELLLDFCAIGMMADDAFAAVTVERGSCFGFAEDLRRGCEAGFWVLCNLLIL